MPPVRFSFDQAPDLSLSDSEIRAIQAVHNGVASAEQQRVAMQAISYKLGRGTSSSFVFGPDGERETAYNEGKRFVALALSAIIKTDIDQHNKEKQA